MNTEETRQAREEESFPRQYKQALFSSAKFLQMQSMNIHTLSAAANMYPAVWRRGCERRGKTGSMGTRELSKAMQTLFSFSKLLQQAYSHSRSPKIRSPAPPHEFQPRPAHISLRLRLHFHSSNPNPSARFPSVTAHAQEPKPHIILAVLLNLGEI
jgi:hypothetical protein